MQSAMATVLVLDTNYFLHFRSVDDIDWRAITEDTDTRLVICAVSLRELERKKVFDPRPGMRQRASAVISRLLELLEAEDPRTRSGVPVEFLAMEPTRVLDSHPLDRTVHDDILIASAIQVAEDNNGLRVIVASDDSGVLLKCRQFKIAYWRPTPQMRLNEPLDEDQRELKRLREENIRLRSAQPRLKLRLEGGGGLVLVQSPEREEEDLPRPIEELKAAFPLLTPDSARALGVSEEERQEYNDALDAYYSSYTDFLGKFQIYGDWTSREISVAFEITNEGTAPADDVDIEVVFNEDNRPIDLDARPGIPVSPKPPKRPRGTVERRSRASSFQFDTLYPNYSRSFHLMEPLADRFLRAMHHEAPNVRGPWISDNNKLAVSWNVRRLKHLETLSLPPVMLLRKTTEVRGADIHYYLHAANIPDLIEGKISFGFKVSNKNGEPGPQADF
jgi:hypothetical protein